MNIGMTVARAPERVATGGYILHTGLDKLRNPGDRAKGLHDMAARAFPPLAVVDPTLFMKLLGVSEVAIGSALLLPVVPNYIAGLGLTTFAGALLTMYWRTPAMHEPNSVWPRPAGIAVSKDVWMLGIGLSLLVGPVTNRRHR